jgi:hypothetical protein
LKKEKRMPDKGRYNRMPRKIQQYAGQGRENEHNQLPGKDKQRKRDLNQKPGRIVFN